MRRSVLLVLASLVALTALFVACGDDGGGDVSNQPGGNDSGELQNLQISKGLTVANLSSTGGQGGDGAESGGAGNAGGGAPSADRSTTGIGGGGVGGGGVGGDSITGQQATTTDNTGITVQGYGAATADADSAIVEFSFSNTASGGVKPYPGYGIQPDGSNAEPITRETLQPVIDALVGAGVSADEIELLSNSYYYDVYSSYATLRATIRDLGTLDGAVEAAQNAADGLDPFVLNSTNVVFTLQNCDALERAAAQAAVEDAADRAAVLADVLDVTLGDVAGASDYSWYNYGTGCGHDYYSPWPIASSPWRVGGSGDGTVQVVSNISVTYAFS